MLALGAGLPQEAADGTSLLVVVLPGEAVDGLGDLVHGLAHAELGVADAAGGVLADGLAAVLLGVSEGDGEVALELLAVGVGGVGAVHGELGGALGGVVHVGDGEGVAGPLVAVKLDEVCIVFSGESPNNAVRGLHFYTDNTVSLRTFAGVGHSFSLSAPTYLYLLLINNNPVFPLRSFTHCLPCPKLTFKAFLYCRIIVLKTICQKDTRLLYLFRPKCPLLRNQHSPLSITHACLLCGINRSLE